MAQFDVHRTRDGLTYVVDCQSDLLDTLATRFVIPLLPEGQVVVGSSRLNPIFVIAGRSMVLMPQGAMTLRVHELGPVLSSLARDEHVIVDAMDFILRGF